MDKILMDQNKHENIFKSFFVQRKLRIKKIPKRNTCETPDFICLAKSTYFWTEVTHIEREEKTSDGWTKTPGKKLRTVINKKRNQLKNAYQIKNYPTLLVIYDESKKEETSLTDITCIFGDLTIEFDRINKVLGKPYQGKNQKFRKGENEFFSTILTARQKSLNEWYYLAYHNPYSSKPFPKNFFKENKISEEELSFEFSD